MILLYFITFGKDKDYLNTCGIDTVDLSDHAPTYLSVDFNLQTKNTKLNSSLLNVPYIKEQIKKEICLYSEFKDNREVSSPIQFDTLKAVLRGTILAISSYKKKIRNKTLEELQNKLNEVVKKNIN